MKRSVLMTGGSLALAACLTVGFAGCANSVWDRAAQLRGEEVTEAEWSAAFAEITPPSAIGMSTAAETASNFSYEYQTTTRSTMSMPDKQGAMQTIDFTMDVTAQVKAAENALSLSMDYNVAYGVNADLVKAFKLLMGMEEDESLSANGSLEAVYSEGNDYLQLNGGAWQLVSETGSDVSSLVTGPMETCLGLLSACTEWAVQFGDFTYDSAATGYKIDAAADLMSGFFGSDGEVLVKFQGGHLAAVTVSAAGEEGATSELPFPVSGETKAAMLFTIGGQTVEIPQV